MKRVSMIESNDLPSIPAIARIPGAEERTIVIDGIRWRYWQAGSGPPLLLIHGLMGYSFSWRFVMPQLARSFTVYAVDLPGCGFSQRCERLDGSLTDDAQQLLGFIEALKLDNLYLLGTSRGGGVTIMLAALASRLGQTRIRKMILSAPINPWSNFGKLRVRLLATYLGGLYAVHVAPRVRPLMRRYFNQLFADPKRIPPDSFDGYTAGLTLPGSFHHVARIMRPWIADLDRLREALPHISPLPILLLWGSVDSAVYPASAYELHENLENSTVLMMDGVGHMPYEEVPEKFSRIVTDFLLHDKPATPLQIAAGASLEAHKKPVSTADTASPLRTSIR